MRACHVGPGPTGYLESKVRGVEELVETMQDRYPRPIPVPVMSLRRYGAIASSVIGRRISLEPSWVRNTHFLSDEQNTRWEIDMAVLVGGGAPWAGQTLGIHWHVASKVEYVATDAESRTLRGCGPWTQTSQANVYTSQPQSSTTAPGG